MSPKSFLFPAMATTMSSGPCSFSSFTHFFSVWKESWATRNTTQLWERIYVWKKYLLKSCLRVIALQCVGQKSFREQTREEWHFIPRMMEKSVNFMPVSQTLASNWLWQPWPCHHPAHIELETLKPSKASKSLSKQKTNKKKNLKSGFLFQGELEFLLTSFVMS